MDKNPEKTNEPQKTTSRRNTVPKTTSSAKEKRQFRQPASVLFKRTPSHLPEKMELIDKTEKDDASSPKDSHNEPKGKTP